MIENTTAKSSTVTPATMLFLICVLWINGGFMRIPYFGALVFLACAAMGMIFAFIEFPDIYKKQWTKSGIIYGVIFFLLILPTALTVHKSITGDPAGILYACILLIVQFYLDRKASNIKKLFIFAVLLDCIAININTLFVLSEEGMASRILATGDALERLEELDINIYMLGGYGYIYSLIFGVVYFYIMKDSISGFPKFQRRVVFLFMATSIITIIASQYTIAIIVLVAGLVFSAVTKHGVTIESILSSIFIIIVLLLTGRIVIGFLVDNHIFGDMVTSRLSMIIGEYDTTHYYGGKSDMEKRIDLYMKTLKLLPETFLHGIYDMKNFGLVLGGHTEWFDSLATYGILKYFFFIMFLIKSIRYSLPKITYKSRYSILIICLIVLGMVNPIICSNLFMWFFILIPYAFSSTDNIESANTSVA